MKRRWQVLQYLKEKGLYDKVSRKLPVSIEHFPTEECDMRDFFMSAFSWEFSAEGREYWEKVNAEYLEWFDAVEKKRRRRVKDEDE